LLIVSDGENHAANLDAVRQEAHEAGVALFTAGVGETSGAPIPILENGQRTFKRDRDGNPVSTRLEEASLQTLADEGAYFRVGRTSSSLPQLIPALERFDRTEYASEQFEDYAEQYQGPLLLAVLLLLAEALLSDRRRPTPKPQNGDPTPDRTPPTAL
jgi:Ca-activated chloride channel family protein